MKSESPISEKFFHSSQFSELLRSAKEAQLKDVKGKLDIFNSPENPVMKEIFGNKAYEKIRINNIERQHKQIQNQGSKTKRA